MYTKTIKASVVESFTDIAVCLYPTGYRFDGVFGGLPIIAIPDKDIAYCAVPTFDGSLTHIVTGTLFQTLSARAQEFVLYHELGHALDRLPKDYMAYLGFEAFNLRMDYQARGLVAPWEVRADLFALYHMKADAIPAMRETIELIHTYYGVDHEMTARLSNLQYHLDNPMQVNLDNFDLSALKT